MTDFNLHRRLFGQHFLKDPSVCKKIVDHFLEKSHAAEQLIEIGPGRGALTQILLAQTQKPVLLIEKDRDLVAFWKGQNVLEADATQLDYGSLLKTHTGILSNLPYSAGTAILLQLVRFPQKICHMTLMFQKEVADRLLAQPGKLTSLAISVQNHWEVKPLLTVKPGAFSPPPKVDSQVISMQPRSQPMITADTLALDRLLKIAFKQKRKMLRSVLGKGSVALQALETVGIDPTRRAETLNFVEWKKWFEQFSQS